MLDQVTHDKVFNRLNTYANDFLAGRNIRQTDEIIIIKGNAIHHAFVNLEMRYRTYAEESWVAEVLDALDPENRLQITDKEFELMQKRRLNRCIHYWLRNRNAVGCLVRLEIWTS
jgi:hypothetical protein